MSYESFSVCGAYNATYDAISGICEDFYTNWKDACSKTSGQGLIVKVAEMSLEVFALDCKEAVASALDSTKTIRGAIAFFDLPDTVSKIAKASYKIYSGIFDFCFKHNDDDDLIDDLGTAGGGMVSLVGSLSKISKSVLDMWTLGSIAEMTPKVSHDFAVFNWGYGSFVGGLSKLFTNAYCFMYPEVAPESFGDLRAQRKFDDEAHNRLNNLSLRVKYAFDGVSGACIAGLGSLSLFFKELATKQNMLGLRLVSVSSEVVARFGPRIVDRFTRI